jgi:HEAT repeat protein
LPFISRFVPEGGQSTEFHFHDRTAPLHFRSVGQDDDVGVETREMMATPRIMKSSDASVLRFLGLCVIGIFCFGNLVHAAEPTYEGRSLSDWLKDLSNTPAGVNYEPAARAFREMGTNAIPFLLSRLEADRPDKYDGDPGLVVNAFREIGSQASNAIPKLSELLLKESSCAPAAAALVAIHAEAPVVALLSRTNDTIRRSAIIALASWSVGKEAVAPLIALLSDADDETRHLAASVLGHIGKEERLTVAALVGAVDDPHFWVRHKAVQALGNFESQATVVYPALLRALTDTNAHVRGSAAVSLGAMMNRFEPSARKKIVVGLIQALSDKVEDVQGSAAWALGTPLPETKEAFAPLLELTKSSSKTVSNTAAAALKHIDREAASKARIK